MIDREPIFKALFGLVSQGEGLGSIPALDAAFGAVGPLVWTSRRVRLWDAVPAKPGLCQLEPAETFTQKPGLPYKAILRAEWWIYHNAGADENAIPSIATNEILQGVETAIEPVDTWDNGNRQTLGGLVFHCFIDGEIIKVSGDIEGEALITVPITILVP